MAEIGFDVLGVERRPEIVEMLRRGQPQFHEPGLPARLARSVRSGRLRVEPTIPVGCDARVYVITVGTPLDDEGHARLDMVERCAEEVATHLRDGDLVVMRSTVKIGTTRRVVQPILERSGKEFDLAYCPERTLEGQAMVELRTLPQIIGGFTPAADVRAAQLFQMLTSTVVRVAD